MIPVTGIVFYREMCHLMQMGFEQEDDHVLTSTDTMVSFSILVVVCILVSLHAPMHTLNWRQLFIILDWDLMV